MKGSSSTASSMRKTMKNLKFWHFPARFKNTFLTPAACLCPPPPPTAGTLHQGGPAVPGASGQHRRGHPLRGGRSGQQLPAAPELWQGERREAEDVELLSGEEDTWKVRGRSDSKNLQTYTCCRDSLHAGGVAPKHTKQEVYVWLVQIWTHEPISFQVFVMFFFFCFCKKRFLSSNPIPQLKRTMTTVDCCKCTSCSCGPFGSRSDHFSFHQF